MTEEKKSLLLVDDDSFLLSLYVRKFESGGFEVTGAGSADEALDLLRGGLKPQAVAFDIVMPHTDGYAFMEIMSRERLASEAAKVALSNETSPENVQRLQALGVDGIIAKASEIPSETVAEIAKIIEKKRSRGASAPAPAE